MNKSLYGLIGYPLGHSFSAAFFKDKFERESIAAEYRNFPLATIKELPQLLATEPALRGFNVTIPYKQAILPYLAKCSDEAAQIGAVNTVRVKRQLDGSVCLEGFNTDVIGFRESIHPLLQANHQQALILGTGGASKAVAYGLTQLGLEYRYVSRTPAPDRLTYADVTPELLRRYTVVVNTTPLGMYPNVETCPNIPYEALTPSHLLYDLVYNPEITTFLRRGAERGAATKNGLEMLHIQAVEAWKIYGESTASIV